MTLHYLGRKAFDGMWCARVRVTGVLRERDLSPRMVPDPITNQMYHATDQWGITDELLWKHIIWLAQYGKSGWCIGSWQERA